MWMMQCLNKICRETAGRLCCACLFSKGYKRKWKHFLFFHLVTQQAFPGKAEQIGELIYFIAFSDNEERLPGFLLWYAAAFLTGKRAVNGICKQMFLVKQSGVFIA